MGWTNQQMHSGEETDNKYWQSKVMAMNVMQ
jgi:hypothetical protein